MNEQSASRSGSAVFTDATTEQKAAMFEWLRQVSLAGKPPEWFHAGLAMHELNRLGGAVSERGEWKPTDPNKFPPVNVGYVLPRSIRKVAVYAGKKAWEFELPPLPDERSD